MDTFVDNVAHPKLSRDPDALRTDRPLVVVVDPRVLTAECLVVALQAIDPSTRFSGVRSLAAFSDNVTDDLVTLVVCVPTGMDARAACLDVRQRLRSDRPRVLLVIVADDESSATISDCIDAGACGYIPTSMTAEMVVQVLKLVRTGCTFVPSSVARALTRPAPAPTLNTLRLNSTQLQIADWIRKGSPNKVIAHQLGISENTVKVQVRSILKKMKVRNRTELSYRSKDLEYLAQGQERCSPAIAPLFDQQHGRAGLGTAVVKAS